MKKSKVLAVVQARMTSTRLPGKVLKPILGRPMLALLMERLGRSKTLDGLLVAMTTNAQDDPLKAWCDANGVLSYRGDEHDVLGRFCGAIAEHPDFDVVVRVTSDCPLLDPVFVDEEVGYFLENRDRFDYVWFGPKPKPPNGSSVEVVTRAALERAFVETQAPYDREHVTPYIQRPENGFRLGVAPTTIDAPDLRLSVDTPQDLALVTAVFEALYPADPAFTLADVVALLRGRPDIRALNAEIRQTTGPYAQTS